MATTTHGGVLYDPFDLDVRADPYPHYARLRRESPIHHVDRDDADFWVISRYKDVMASARDVETFSSEESIGIQRDSEFVGKVLAQLGLTPDVMPELPKPLIATDPPRHTRIRRLLSKEFTPRAIGERETHIRALCQELVGDMVDANERGEADIVQQLAIWLPALVIIDMLGVPTEDRVTLKEWTDAGVGLLGGGIDPTLQLETLGAGMNLFNYFDQLIAERRREPREDLLTMLVHAEEQGDMLSHEELIGQCVILIVGGHETTTNLIGNAFKAFFAHPDQFEKVLVQRELIPSAVEETLRYDAPVQGLFRDAMRDVEFPSATIPKGARAQLLYGSGNRDEDHYPDPDRFLVDRGASDHFGFGHGVHYCIGAPLARLETRIAIETVLDRCRDLQPNGESQLNYNVLVRGPRTLPVTFESTGA